MTGRRAFLAGGAAFLLLPVPASLAARGGSAVVTGDALGPVNAYRRAKGRGPLVADAALSRAALDQASRMAASGKLSHARFRQRMAENGVPSPAAENIAFGQPTVASVVEAWIGSRGHRANILGGYNRLGVAVARDSASGNRPYWAMVLSV
ncbi:MAG: CAP domain-containing protein [Oricola sp.]